MRPRKREREKEARGHMGDRKEEGWNEVKESDREKWHAKGSW